MGAECERVANVLGRRDTAADPKRLSEFGERVEVDHVTFPVLGTPLVIDFEDTPRGSVVAPGARTLNDETVDGTVATFRERGREHVGGDDADEPRSPKRVRRKIGAGIEVQ
jgi:hypothetical protein